MILAIETAIAGGSLSLIRNGEQIARLCGEIGISRAEDLLHRIDSLLGSTAAGLDHILAIAVSVGPGSFTGLRIGLSTAIGLSAALGKPPIGVSLFHAIATALDAPTGITIAVPLGRSDICFQQFSGLEAKPGPIVASELEFIDFILANECKYVACHPEIIGRLRSSQRLSEGCIYPLDQCLATYVGQYAATASVQGSLDPIYVQNPRFV